MNKDYKDVQEWFAKETNRTVEEFDQFDVYIVNILYKYKLAKDE